MTTREALMIALAFIPNTNVEGAQARAVIGDVLDQKGMSDRGEPEDRLPEFIDLMVYG